MSSQLMLVGASLRPLLQSAAAAGFQGRGWDRFGDWDASRVEGFQLDRIDDYGELIHRAYPADAEFLLCGGSELDLALVQALASRGQLLGPGEAALTRLRDRLVLLQDLQAAGVPVPRSRAEPPPVAGKARWLQKPRAGCGGLGITHWPGRQDPIQHSGVAHEVYFQEQVGGESMSALVISGRHPEGGGSFARVWGVSRQLVGRRDWGAPHFTYCGSLRERPGELESLAFVHELARYLAETYDLAGVWGMDLVEADGQWLLVDLNARIPASAELWEAAVSLAGDPQLTSLLAVHRQAVLGRLQPDQLESLLAAAAASPPEGKAILFQRSQREQVVSSSQLEQICRHYRPDLFQSVVAGAWWADLPMAGTRLSPGAPVLTVRVRGTTGEDLLARLRGEVMRAESVFCAGSDSAS